MCKNPLFSLSGWRSFILCVRTGYDRRFVLDGDGAQGPQEGDHRHYPALYPGGDVRLPARRARAFPGHDAERRHQRVQQGPNDHHDVE